MSHFENCPKKVFSNLEIFLLDNFLSKTCWDTLLKMYLEIYPIQLGVLVANLGSHIRCHIAQISNHGRHLLHIFFHLFFTIVISNP